MTGPQTKTFGSALSLFQMFCHLPDVLSSRAKLRGESKMGIGSKSRKYTEKPIPCFAFTLPIIDFCARSIYLTEPIAIAIPFSFLLLSFIAPFACSSQSLTISRINRNLRNSELHNGSFLNTTIRSPSSSSSSSTWRQRIPQPP